MTPVTIVGECLYNSGSGAIVLHLASLHFRALHAGSIAGFFAAPALAPYSMSKHAMEAFSDALLRELRPLGVHVSLLEPGAIATDIWQKGLSEFDAIARYPPPGLQETYGGLINGLRDAAQRSATGASPIEVVS